MKSPFLNRCFLSVFVFAVVLISFDLLSAPEVKIRKIDDKFRVEIDGELFTEYLHKGFAKPILYPVIGPHSIPMTRNYPMKDVKGEARDHHHHKSLWFTHGAINGVDFWAERDSAGKVLLEKVLEIKNKTSSALLKTANRWLSSKGKLVCTDTRTLTFSTLPACRVIDFEITLNACNGDLTFGDTKEGTMGIRTHPNLRIDNDKGRGVTTANGDALNSEGDKGKKLWGKRAKWVDYWGKVDGKTVGVGIFDHPDNPRHPTWWHARAYGLIAANPFGVHNFERKPKGTGDLKVKSGDSITFRYRFVFHSGDVKQAGIKKLYKQFEKK